MGSQISQKKRNTKKQHSLKARQGHIRHVQKLRVQFSKTARASASEGIWGFMPELACRGDQELLYNKVMKIQTMPHFPSYLPAKCVTENYGGTVRDGG